MASREIKDELQAESVSPQAAPQAASPIQITTDPDLQSTLVEVILDDFDKAQSDRNARDYGITSKGENLNFDEWLKRLKDMYSGNRIPKTIPWRFCSNRSLRIATSILDLMHSRLFPSVWNEDLTRWRSSKSIDTPKVERISKFMDWWIRVWAPLRSFYDTWVKVVAGFGDSLTETVWDIETRTTNETIDIPIMDESQQPLVNQDGTPAVQKQVKVDKIEKTMSKIIEKENVFMMKGARDIQRDVVLIKETFLFHKLEEMERKGTCVNVTTELAKHIIVPEPSGNIDPLQKEKLRKIKLRNMPVETVRWYGIYDVDGTGIEESTRIIVCPEYRVYLGGVRMRDITKSGRRPLDFTKYDNYLDKPNELEGEGLLAKVRELAEEIDACFNQLTDANTLGVLRPFFYDPSGDVDAPALNLGPNKGIPVTDPQRNVYFPPIEIPTERLINAIRLVMEFIERLTAASEYVMGRESGVVGGSGTATRTNAIVQSAEIRFTLPSERLRQGAARILNNHLDLIQLNIPKGMEERVLGEKGEPIFLQGELSDESISGEFSAYLLPDPSMGSKQTERELMGQIYSILMQNVVVGTDPAKIHYVTSQWLKANGKDDDFIMKSLGPAPLQDEIDDPEDENTLMIQGDFKRVRANIAENHLYHIQKHMELEMSPAFQALAATAPNLTNQILEYNRSHIQEHMQMMGQMMALTKSAGTGGALGQGAGNSNEGTDNSGANSSGEPGVENTPGPMGQALNQQRKGESGKSPSA